MAKDALETLGTILTEGIGRRDAIHIAVVSVVAGHRLRPGEDVMIDDASHTTTLFVRGIGLIDEPIGIVDPFLARDVEKGESFWLLLYPRSITSLRHVWEHPAFPKEYTPKASAEPGDKAASEEWLRNFTAHADCPDYYTVMSAATGNGTDQWSDDCLHFDGQNAHGEIPPEFWDHVETVTGTKVPRRAKYFSCGC